MRTSNLDLELLNTLCDDYENVESIAAALRETSEINPSSETILTRLRFLSSKNLIEVYEYDVSRQEFVRKSKMANVDFSSAWFFISEQGRKRLDSDWGNKEDA